MRPPARRTVGAGAGFAGDRLEPAVALAASGVVQDLVLECLAERTLVAGLRARRSGEGAGHDPRLRARLAPLLPHVAAGRCRVVSNLGAADPEAAALATAALAQELGLRGVRVAAVLGDDVADRAAEVAWDGEVGSGDLLGAHAYVGATTIAEALEQGADVVLCGRASDSALFLGPLRAALDGSAEATAGALAVGHLLECSGQLTGGNHQDPGGARLRPEDLARLGYPLARVAADGTAELRLLDGAPGRLDALVCTLQLLYEVHDPAAYVTPDGVLDMTGIRFEERGGRAVGVSGARLASGPPQRLKVSGFVARPGVLVDAEIGFAGDGALERARDAAQVLGLRLEAGGVGAAAIDLVGVDSLLGPASNALAGPPPEVRVHVTAPCEDPELARLVEDEVFGLTLTGPPAGGGVRVERRPHVAVLDGRLDRERVTERVAWA